MNRLIEESDIRREVAALGRTLSQDYEGRPLTVLGVLTGSVVLVADVIRHVSVPLQLEFVRASSYRGRTTTAGGLTIEIDKTLEIADRDVLVVDDILDTGRTLFTLCEALRAGNPRSLRTAVLLWKPERTENLLRPDYSCFQIPNAFVVGYGLDYNGEFRHLPYIAALEDGDLEKDGARVFPERMSAERDLP